MRKEGFPVEFMKTVLFMSIKEPAALGDIANRTGWVFPMPADDAVIEMRETLMILKV
jgi:hypothetical protein